MKPLALLTLPALAAAFALETGRLPFKLGVPVLCALILIAFVRHFAPNGRRAIWAVAGAFAMSAVGDYFLSNRGGHARYFEVGIAAYLVAHLGYICYALLDGRLHRMALAALLVGFVPYFGLALSPAIADRTLWAAVLLYLLISCLSLSAALGLRQPVLSKTFYIAGIGLVVLSDTLISFSEFLRFHEFNGWILPTYYLAHLAITSSILLRPDRRHSRTPGGCETGSRRNGWLTRG